VEEVIKELLTAVVTMGVDIKLRSPGNPAENLKVRRVRRTTIKLVTTPIPSPATTPVTLSTPTKMSRIPRTPVAPQATTLVTLLTPTRMPRIPRTPVAPQATTVASLLTPTRMPRIPRVATTITPV